MNRKSNLLQRWQQLSIYHKTVFLLGCMVLIMCALVLFVIAAFQQYRTQTSAILNEHASISSFLTAFSSENDLLRYRVRGESEMIAPQYAQACVQTDTMLDELASLPSVTREGELLRHAIFNAMTHYRTDQAALMQTVASRGDYVALYYSMRKQFNYIDQYSKNWLRISVRDGARRFRKLTDYMRNFYFVLFALLIIAFFAVICACITLMKSIIVPLAALSASAASFQAGNPHAPDIKIHSSDEIGTLAMSFDSMKRRVNEAFRELSEKALMEQQLRLHEQRESQMRRLLEERRFSQLQSQINPHFLFNTLNTISSMAKIEHATVTEDLILRLSKLFRYSLETGDKLVPLRQELQIVRDYMELQETRFGDRFTFEIINAEDFYNLQIPKFIIQPLAENAVIHGMQNIPAGGKIRLTFRAHGPHSFRILFTDNGCGFRPGTDSRQKSVGLSNICNRMEIFGGESRIFSIPGMGTTVCLTVPRKETV